MKILRMKKRTDRFKAVEREELAVVIEVRMLGGRKGRVERYCTHAASYFPERLQGGKAESRTQRSVSSPVVDSQEALISLDNRI